LAKLPHRFKRFRPFALLPVIVLLVSSLLAAGPAQPPPPDWPQVFRLGYVPIGTAKNGHDPFQLMGNYLTRELGIPVKMVALGNYLAVIHGLKNRSLEGALLGPNAYVEAAALTGIELAAMELYYPGHRGYQSVLITRKGSNLRRLEDARGKVLAFSDPDSTSGFLVPMLHFVRDLGVAPAGFASKVVFAGSHGAVAKGVFEGRYALGATNDVDLARAIAELNLQMTDFQVLWTSQMIPGAPYCIRKDLPDSLKAAYRRALFNLKDPMILDKLKIVGLSPVADSEYDIIRELKKLNQ